MKSCVRMIIAGACLLAAGCLPEKRIVWAPDGSKAVIATDSGLRFIDAAYKVLPAKLDGKSIRAAWFRDSKELAVVRPVEVSKWDELTSVLTPDQANLINQSAQSLWPRILKFEGDWNKFEIDPEKRLTPGLEAALLVYVRENATAEVREKLGEKWKDLADLKPSVNQLEICEFNHDQVRSGKVLLRSLEQIHLPATSPDGKYIAYLRMSEKSPQAQAFLFMVSTAGGPEVPIAENVATGFDWGTDSMSIAYIHAPISSGDDSAQLKLGALATAEFGYMNSRFGVTKAVDHAGLFFNEALQVQWLKDGRLMFSSVEVNLPVTARDMPQRWSIFVIDPKYPATIQRLLARDFTKAMEMNDQRFALSPDNNRVAMLGPDGAINVYDFASGETSGIESPEGFECASFPSWRNNDELIFARAPKKESDKIGEVVVWRDKKESVVSTNWPTDMTAWLKKAD